MSENEIYLDGKIEVLESKLKAVTEEKDKLGEMGAATQDALRRVMSERDALRLRVTTLEGKTGFCTQCEAYAKLFESWGEK